MVSPIIAPAQSVETPVPVDHDTFLGKRMVRITCSYRRQDDQSYLLTPIVSSFLPHAETIVLSGYHAQLWEMLVTLAISSRDAQALILESVEPSISSRLLAAISVLVKAGCLQMDAGFASDTTIPPPASQLYKLHLEITNRCNFKCRACYLGPRLSPSRASTRSEGTTDQWLQVIKNAASLGCKRAIVTGGEPFVRRDVTVLLHALTENGIATEINTNASLITPGIANACRSLLISVAAVTLYGFDNDSTAAYTGNMGGFNASLRGIRCLVDAGIPVFVKYFATRMNADGFPVLYNVLKPLGVDVRFMDRGVHGDLFTGTLPAADIVRQLPISPITIQEDRLPCYPSISGLAVEPDGTVRPCPKLTVYFGNAFNDGLTQLWQHSADLSAFRTFWVHYCTQMGYVSGTHYGSLCPAGDMLSIPSGIKTFRELWNQWLKRPVDD